MAYDSEHGISSLYRGDEDVNYPEGQPLYMIATATLNGSNALNASPRQHNISCSGFRV